MRHEREVLFVLSCTFDSSVRAEQDGSMGQPPADVPTSRVDDVLALCRIVGNQH